MLLANKQVAIVGGGPGGLTLARLLQLKGVNVKVYERDMDKDARLVGSPLDMHEGSGMAALIKAGLLDEFKKNFRPGADKKIIVNEQAVIQFSDHDTKPVEDFGNAAFHPEIDRGPLRNILLDSLQPGTILWNRHFISLEAAGEGWQLRFKNADPAYADIVIAADGANSRIRPYLTDARPFYTGITMLEGNVHNAEKSVPTIYTLLNGGKLMAFGNEKNLLMGLKANGDLTFYATFKPAANWAASSGLEYSDNKQMLAWFRETYTGWSSAWYQLFEKASTPFIPRPITCMPLDQSWIPLPNLTMIGDAAHVMPPFAGEGANMAMLDALELSEYLTTGKYSAIHEAITAFENSMRKRSAVAARQSLDNGERMHSANALEQMLKIFS